MSVADPSAAIVIREHNGQPFYEAKFRHQGRQIKRRIGPAWVERNPETAGWRRRRGRVEDGAYDERAAHVAAAAIVGEYVATVATAESAERELREQGATFREVARAYLDWLRNVRGAKPSTLVGHECVLAEPGEVHKRGSGKTAGCVMAALGDRPASKVTTREIEDLLDTISQRTTTRGPDGQPRRVTPRTVNKHRAVIAAVFSYGCKPSTFALPSNPGTDTDKRREPGSGPLVFYTPDEVEAIACALADGRHRTLAKNQMPAGEADTLRLQDTQDAELVRVASYAGLRQGELLALRWCHIDLAGSALTVSRAMSARTESSTKSGLTRRVPLAGQAAAALKRLQQRRHFTSPDDLVFCNDYGRPLDESALRRRYRRAQAIGGVRPLRFHDLRHTFGSQLAARGIDLVTIKEAMGHTSLSTTSRYLHARPASEQADAFTRAFEPA